MSLAAVAAKNLTAVKTCHATATLLPERSLGCQCVYFKFTLHTFSAPPRALDSAFGMRHAACGLRDFEFVSQFL